MLNTITKCAWTTTQWCWPPQIHSIQGGWIRGVGLNLHTSTLAEWDVVCTGGQDWGLWRSWLLTLWANSIDLWNQSWELELLETPCNTSIKFDPFAFLVVTYVASVHPISRNRAASCLVNLICQCTTNCSSASVNCDIILVLVFSKWEREREWERPD